MATITLIGTRLAEVGREFVYDGEAAACEGCPYRTQCLNLEEGARYRITALRENAQVLECGVHDDGVTAVEVERAPITANVPSRVAYTGSRARLAGECPYEGCPSHEYCVPDGAELDREYRIQEVVGEPPHDHCMLDRDLTLVEFSPEE